MNISPVRRYGWRLGRRLYSRCRWDYPNDPAINGEYALVRRVMRSGVRRSFVDVGANRGLWAKKVIEEARKTGREPERLILVEPNPSLINELFRLFGSMSSFVSVEPVALSDRVERRPFYVETTSGGTSSLWTRPEGDVQEIVVEVTTFDNLFGDKEFGMVKIDAEGGDLLVLRGMREALAAGRVGLVQFEYNIRWRGIRAFLKDAWDIAEQYGYQFGKVTPSGGVLLSGWNDELERFFEANYFLARSDTAERLGLPKRAWDTANTL